MYIILSELGVQIIDCGWVILEKGLYKKHKPSFYIETHIIQNKIIDKYIKQNKYYKYIYLDMFIII